MSFSVCSLNLNGIRAAEKRGFSKWLEKRKPDVLCLQELRAAPDQVPEALRSPPGYNTRWLTADKKGYAGVAIFARRPADAYTTGSGLEWADAEARVLRAECEAISVLSVYIPSGSSSEERLAKKLEYLPHFESFVKRLARTKKPALLCGDFNVAHAELDIHAPKRNVKNSGFLPEERAWFGRLLKQGWVDVLRAEHPDEPGLYSWWSARGRAREKDLGWRLDYTLANRSLAKSVVRTWIEKDAGLSDHAPVWAEFELEC